jgi:predicted nucleic acid-binding protein
VAGFALDSSVMVAAVCSWHERHGSASAAIERRLATRQRLITPAHAMVEAYAVLTRLPAPHRLAPVEAWGLVKTNFVDGRLLVVAPAATQVTTLESLAQAGRGGGRTYDALIAAAAVRAGASELLTLNPTHFDDGPPELTIVAL